MLIGYNPATAYLNTSLHTKFKSNFDNSRSNQSSLTTADDSPSQLKLLQQQLVNLRSSLEELQNPLDYGSLSTSKNFIGKNFELVTAAQSAVAASTSSNQPIVLGPLEDDDPLDIVPQFATVTNGTIDINGTGIAIDVTADSLNDIITAINGSAADVTATLSAGRDSVSIVSNNTTQNLTLSSGGTGFFEALEINEGTYNFTPGVDAEYEEVATSTSTVAALTERDSKSVTSTIKDIATSISTIFDDNTIQAEEGGLVSIIRESLKSAVSEGFDASGSQFSTDYGINIDFKPELGTTFDFLKRDQNQLIEQLTTDVEKVNELFYNNDNRVNDGLLEKVLTSLKLGQEQIKDELGSAGIFIDTFA